jgi:hypothetical protein
MNRNWKYVPYGDGIIQAGDVCIGNDENCKSSGGCRRCGAVNFVVRSVNGEPLDQSFPYPPPGENELAFLNIGRIK